MSDESSTIRESLDEEIYRRWDEIVFPAKQGKEGKHPGNRQQPITLGEAATAIEESNGVMTEIVTRLGIYWSTGTRILDDYPCLKQLFDSEREKMTDLAEQVIRGNVRTAMIQHAREQQLAEQSNLVPRQVESSDARWWLSRIGKSRGFGEQVSLDVSSEKPIPIIVIQPGELEALLPKGEDK